MKAHIGRMKEKSKGVDLKMGHLSNKILKRPLILSISIGNTQSVD